MALVGYARVSTTDQDLSIQLAALTGVGCEKVFCEKRSGTSVAGRDELADALSWIRDGDTLVITRLDRLARSMPDLYEIVGKLDERGCALKVIQQPEINTDTTYGKLLLSILGAFAAFETDLRKERQKEGIKRARVSGDNMGRPQKVDPVRVRRLAVEGYSVADAAKMLGCHRATVHRLCPDYRELMSEARDGGVGVEFKDIDAGA
jgi:DNA invertase Pin-like site-specific DNA recombinase